MTPSHSKVSHRIDRLTWRLEHLRGIGDHRRADILVDIRNWAMRNAEAILFTAPSITAKGGD